MMGPRTFQLLLALGGVLAAVRLAELVIRD